MAGQSAACASVTMSPYAFEKLILLSGRCRNAYLVRVYEIDVVNFAGHFHRFGSRFLFGLGQERQQELIRELGVQLFKIWHERHGSLLPHEGVGFTAGCFREFSKIILAPGSSKVAVSKVSGARRID